MFLIFKWHKESEPWEKVPGANATTYHVGDALTLSGGVYVKATGAVKPEYICMENVTTTAAGQPIHAERVRDETIYESTLSVASSSIAVGGKYTIDATGSKVTATGNGVCQVVNFDGKQAGDKVRIRFVDAASA